ncbi:hypothetical protein TcCL_NonESM04572 [Trypanosoma cruzi]|nr:hypothetical protein TcCL_NonESM04572 [Trypanosoma cruzi]
MGDRRPRSCKQGKSDRQAERKREMDAVKRHSQSTWPVSMRPLHVGTQQERVRGEKQEAAQHTRKEQTTGGKSTAKGINLLATPHQPSHTHTPSQCRQSAGERIRPSTQQTRTPPAVTHQWTRKKRDTPPPVQSHGQRNTATARSQHTTHTELAITQRATRGSGSSSSHDAATTFPVIPPTMEFDAQLKAVIGGASRQQQN